MRLIAGITLNRRPVSQVQKFVLVRREGLGWEGFSLTSSVRASPWFCWLLTAKGQDVVKKLKADVDMEYVATLSEGV